MVASLDSLARKIANLVNAEKLTHNEYRRLLNTVRARINFLDGKRPKVKVIRNLPEVDIKKIRDLVLASTNNQHLLIFYVLYYTGIRVNELVHIELAHLNLAENTLLITEGKGNKERIVILPPPLKEALGIFINSLKKRVYLFESYTGDKYSTRAIHQIIAKYGKAAGLAYNLHPHLFRHHYITKLRLAGLQDFQIQPLTGHASRKSLDTYSHITPLDIREQLYGAIPALR